MSLTEIATGIGSAFGVFGAIYAGYLSTRRVNRGAQQTGTESAGETAWKIVSNMEQRLTAAEKDVTGLRTDLDTERAHSKAQDDAIHQLEQQLAKAVRHLRSVWTWIDSGAKPPPPTRPDWLTGLPGWNGDNTNDD